MTSPAPSSRPELAEIRVPGPREPWAAAGLARPGLAFGADRLELAVAGLAGDAGGLPIVPAAAPAPVEGVDHVVALTPDFDGTRDALVAAGFDHRRDRDAGEGRRQAFFVLGACLLELAGPVEGDPRLWGITFVVEDLDAAKAALGDLLGAPKDAVQAGRRIATVRREAGLGIPVALMTPRT